MDKVGEAVLIPSNDADAFMQPLLALFGAARLVRLPRISFTFAAASTKKRAGAATRVGRCAD